MAEWVGLLLTFRFERSFKEEIFFVDPLSLEFRGNCLEKLRKRWLCAPASHSIYKYIFTVFDPKRKLNFGLAFGQVVKHLLRNISSGRNGAAPRDIDYAYSDWPTHVVSLCEYMNVLEVLYSIESEANHKCLVRNKDEIIRRARQSQQMIVFFAETVLANNLFPEIMMIYILNSVPNV